MAVIPYGNAYSQDVNEFGQKATWVGITDNPSGGSISIPVVYGQRRIEGIRLWNVVKPTDSSILYCAYALSEDWCQGMTQLFIDDTLVELPPTAFEHRIPIQVSQGKYAGILEVEFVDGRNASAYYGSVTNIGPSVLLQRELNTNYNWNNLCYVVCKFTYQAGGPYQQFPKVTVDLSGRKIAPWTSSTGYNYTDNPAYVIWDLMSNTSYGRGILKSKIDTTSFTTVYNSCNTVRTGVTSPGAVARCNWICDTNNSVLSNINLVLETFQLSLSFIQDKWVLTAEQAPNASPLTFDESNIIDSVQLEYPTVNERYNRVIVDYIEPTYNFQTFSTQFPPVGVNTYLDEDNGLILEKRITVNMCTNAVVANDIAQMTLLRSRNQIIYRFRTTKEAHQARVGDYAFINTVIPYVANQKCIIIEMTMNNDYTFDMTCISYSPTWYPTGFTNNVSVPQGGTPPPVVVPTISWGITSTRDTSNYALTEGQSIVWTIGTLNVAEGTTFHWRITGTVTSADFQETAMTGTGTIASGVATVSRTTTNPNLRAGPRNLIFTIYDSTGTTQLAQHSVTLNDPGVTVGATGYTYTFASAPTLDNTIDYYLGYTTASDPTVFDTNRTKMGTTGATQQLGYQSLIKINTTTLVYELNIGLIDRKTANQTLDRLIYMVYTHNLTDWFGYYRQSGTSTNAVYGPEFWKYDPEFPPVTGDTTKSLLSGGTRYNNGLRNYIESATGGDFANFENGTIRMLRTSNGQYQTAVPLRINVSGFGTNNKWPVASGNGSFFTQQSFDNLNAATGIPLYVKFFEYDYINKKIITIGTKSYTLKLTTAGMSAGDLAANRTVWASKGFPAQF